MIAARLGNRSATDIKNRYQSVRHRDKKLMRKQLSEAAQSPRVQFDPPAVLLAKAEGMETRNQEASVSPRKLSIHGMMIGLGGHEMA
jgi:hypothetical protein